MHRVYTLPWWFTPFVIVGWVFAFVIWLTVAIFLGTMALGVEAVRWLHAHLRPRGHA